MIYDIKAIPTKYAGVQFRSRLEARWAAFFDLCKWQWEYEPFDLSGWAPDFSIKKKDGGRVLIEVKPFDFRHWTDVREQHDHIYETYSKCWQHVEQRCQSEIEDNSIFLLGTGPFYSDRRKEAFVGMWAYWHYSEVSLCSSMMMTTKNGVYDILPVGEKGILKREWEDMMRGRTVFCSMMQHALIDTKDYLDIEPVPKRSVEDMWRDAGNMVQWKPS